VPRPNTEHAQVNTDTFNTSGEELVIPYNFVPRPYQLPLFQAIDSGYKRACVIWCRRAGKDKALFNLLIKKALERVGVYFYFFPTFTQGRKVIWDGIDNDGFRFLHHVPDYLIESKNNQEMKIVLTNGSVIQVVGTDDVDRVRGTNPVGCVFSEFSWQNPQAWDIVRPILTNNGGWAVFNSTPFGKNHFYKLYQQNKDRDNWFCEVVTVEDMLDENGNRFVSDDMIQEEIDSGMDEDLVQQEFYCSFTAVTKGFFYSKQLVEAEQEGRVTNVPYDPAVPVDTWWDLGINDSTAIWFTQTVNKEIHVIDYYERNGEPLDHYAKILQRKDYVYGKHHFPHDVTVRELGTGRSRLEVLEDLLGARNVEVIPKLSREDGISAARMLLPRCWFDAEKCKQGLDALQNYHKEWDETRKTFKNTPAHDWSSHAADAFRYFAVGYEAPRRKLSRKDKLVKKYSRQQRRTKGYLRA
jgi:hypothetical protein